MRNKVVTPCAGWYKNASQYDGSGSKWDKNYWENVKILIGIANPSKQFKVILIFCIFLIETQAVHGATPVLSVWTDIKRIKCDDFAHSSNYKSKNVSGCINLICSHICFVSMPCKSGCILSIPIALCIRFLMFIQGLFLDRYSTNFCDSKSIFQGATMNKCIFWLSGSATPYTYIKNFPNMDRPIAFVLVICLSLFDVCPRP